MEIAMKILYPTSLAATIDAINDAFFFSRPIAAGQKREAARWIAGRVMQGGSYYGMPAPTKKDLTEEFRVFTGERITTRVGKAHILGEEACRVMILLGGRDRSVREAIEAATAVMVPRLQYDQRPGWYCCGKCSCAMWRHLAVGGLDKTERRLAAAVKALKANRDGQGKWKVFPFYYALLALCEIDLPAAVTEMRYASSACEKLLSRRTARDDKYTQRRRALAERVLARC